MKPYILFISIWLCQMSLVAQVVVVRDRTTLDVLPGVVFSSARLNKSVQTGADGRVEISPLKTASDILIAMIGYERAAVSYDSLAALKGPLFLVSSAFYMDEMVVSASRFEEKEEDVAQQVQVLDSRELRFINQQTSADVLAQSGNVFVQKSQLGGGSPVIRGFEANKVQLVIDGVRMNNAIYRGGHLQDVVTLDNTIMDRVEISFGPGSVVYGSDALGGVMSFYTRRPNLTEGKTTLSGGVFTRFSTVNNENTGHIDFNVGGGRLASLTSFTYSSFGDLRQGTHYRRGYDGVWDRPWYVDQVNGQDSAVVNDDKYLQVGSAYKQYDILQKLLFKQNDKVTHQLNIQYSTSSDVPRYDRLTLLRNGKPRFAEWYYGPQNRMLAAYTLELKNKNRVYDESRIILSYQDIDQSRVQRSYQSANRDSRIEDVNVLALNADFMKQFGTHELRYGTEISHNDVSSTANRKNIETGTVEPLDTRYPDGGSAMSSAAVYLTDSWEVKPWMLINAGARASHVTLDANFVDTTFYPFPFSSIQQSNTAVNGSLGLIFRTNKDWRISAVGATGFRAPNVDDLSKVFESVPGQVVVPNPDLRPEKVTSVDVGIEKRVNDDFHFRTTAYYTWFTDAITSVPGKFNGQDSIEYSGQTSGVLTSVNAAEVYIYGFSVQMTGRLAEHVDISSSLNYTYGRIKTDSTDYPLDHIPPVFGRTGVNVHLSKFRGEVYAMYNGWKKLDDYNLVGEDNFAYATPDGMPSWATLNVRCAYSINNYLQILGAVENVFDYNYRSFSSNISAPGRNISVTLKARI